MRFIFLVLLVVIFSCSKNNQYRTEPISEVEIIPVVKDSNLSVRALEIGTHYIYYGSSDHMGRIGLKKEMKVNLNKLEVSNKINHYKNVLTAEDKPLHFRAIAEVEGDFFAISIGNPARLYKLPRKGEEPRLVYEEKDSLVFYDSMKFWNAKEGIAIGDPTDDCMSIIITRDGGNSWNKLSCEDLPKSKVGEAAFAASDTNISIIGDHTWVATGGESSRVLFSNNKGQSWEVFETTITQGKPTTGLYSIDFYDQFLGYGIGGDYTNPNDSVANKIRTTDGGKTWDIVSNNKAPGYRSCVQYIPHSDGEELVAVGFKGIDYSSDGGESWTKLSDEGFYTIRFINDTMAYAGGRGRISKLVFR